MLPDYLFDAENKVWVRKDYERRIDYSEGEEMEKCLYEAVKNSKDVSVLSEELESKIFNWSSRYFFSKKRANLLRPFASLFKGKHILEPGCGAGSITRFLGECGASVAAIEPGLPRAKIAAERCRDLDNVTIFCDDIDNFHSDRQFDGILLIGVLEYATRYSTDEKAALNFITHLKKFLTKDGFIITAIENQLGLKYFAGFQEDHAGTMMHGIDNNYQPGEATTWGRKALIGLFESAGFVNNQLFLPFPDYKMPSLIFYPGFNEMNKNNDFRIENILSNISYQDLQPCTPLFSLDKALPLIAKNDLLYDLSNSFCLFSQFTRTQYFDEQILFTLYATERKKEYCKETVFKQQEGSIKVIRNYLPSLPTATESIISFNEEEPVWPGTLHYYELVKIINYNNWHIHQLHTWINTWFECLKTELVRHYTFTPQNFLNPELKVSSIYIDAIPINLLIHETGFRFIDMEINLNQDIEVGYIVFRAIYVSFSRLSSIAVPAEPAFSEIDYIIHALFAVLGFQLTEDQLLRYYGYEAQLISHMSSVKMKTVKESFPGLKIRPVINELSEMKNYITGLQHEIHSLSTSRKRMIRQFIKRTLGF